MLSFNAGTLNAGLVAWCEQAYSVLWLRYMERSGRSNVSGMEACMGGTGTGRVMDFPSEPFGIPNRVYVQDIELPMERWLLFGVTFVDFGRVGFSRTKLNEVITSYVYLTEEPAPPIGSRPPLPAYESIREAERAVESR
jgi:hypothetical protein